MMEYCVEKSPVGARVAGGPKPSGGNRSADDVSCAASLDGQPSVGTLPEIVIVSPGDAVDGSTLMLASAHAVETGTNNAPMLMMMAARARVALRRAGLTMAPP